MTVKDMHYDVKVKLNKIDSQQYKNLLVPEIDWALNEAQELFINIVANPRLRNHLGFEIGQRSIDDIKEIVVRPDSDNYPNIKIENDTIILPDNYWHFLNCKIQASKGSCKNQIHRLIIRQHDDMFEESPFDKSSFKWRFINGVFYDKGIKLFPEDKTVLNKVKLSYLRFPRLIHNAEDFRGGKYKLPGGRLLVGHQDCEFPSDVCRQIVDIAVFNISENLQLASYQTKLAKLKINQLT